MPALSVSAAPVTRPSFFPANSRHKWLLRRAGCLIMLVAGLSLSACDRQKPEAPQAQAEPSAAATATPQRYRIDRSHAGEAMPDAVLAASGTTTELAELSGVPMVVNLWATWCAPCVEELPTLDNLARAQGDSIAVVAVSQDIGSDADGPAQFLATRGWTNLTALHDPENALGLRYGGALPTTILFDAAGRETARVIGPLDWTGPVAARLIAEAGGRP